MLSPMTWTSQIAVWSLRPKSHAVNVGASGSAGNSIPTRPRSRRGHDAAAVNASLLADGECLLGSSRIFLLHGRAHHARHAGPYHRFCPASSFTPVSRSRERK